MRVVLQILLRSHRLRPWQSALAALGIALGVAVVVAVQLTQASARDAFDAANMAIFGRATHRIEAKVGPVTDATCATLRREFPEIRAVPVVQGYLRVEHAESRWLEIIGIDPLVGPGDAGGTAVTAVDEVRALVGEAALLANAETRASFSRAGDEFLRVTTEQGAERRIPLKSIRQTRFGTLPRDVLLMDIAAAQDLLGARGQLDHVDIDLSRVTDRRAYLARIRQRLGPGHQLRDLADEAAGRRELSRAFETSLTALSLMSLLVGMFLVYNTTDFLLVQRNPVFQRLVALGVGPHALFHALVLESLLLGATASAVGVGGGVLLARALLGLVNQTMQGFYLAAGTEALQVSPWLLGAGWLGGSFATLFAGLPAAIRGARITPLSRGEFSRPITPRRKISGAQGCATIALTGAVGLHALNTGTLWLDFITLSLGLLGLALLIPALAQHAFALIALALARSRWWPEYIAAASLRRTDNRAGTAIAALSLAIAVSLGMQTMTLSFREAVANWLSRLLRADAYLSVPEETPALVRDQVLRDLERHLKRNPRLAATSSVTRWDVQGEAGPLALVAYALPPQARAGFELLAGRTDDLWARWKSADVVMVSEPWANRHHLAPGMVVRLPTPAGARAFEVAAIYRDYANERGTLAMSRLTALRHWPTSTLNRAGLGLYLKPGEVLSTITREISLSRTRVPVVIRSRKELADYSLQIFDRTFAITRLLALLAVAVSMTGVTAALLAQILERLREQATLRALGATRAVLLRVMGAQALMMGGVASLLAIPTGLATGAFLVHVVNLHAFGWTMPLTLSPRLCASMAAGGLLACLLAVLPALARLLSVQPATALREE